MKYLILIILVFVGPRTFAQMSCENLFDAPQVYDAEARAVAQSLYSQLQDLEKKVAYWSQLSGQYERATLMELRQRRKKFQFYVEQVQDEYSAVEIYRDLFRVVEFSYADLLTGRNTSPVLSAEREEMMRLFAENYSEYVYVRSYLESLAYDKESPLSPLALRILSRLGIIEIAQRFPALGYERTRPRLNDIRDFYRQDPRLLILKLKKDLREERRLAVRIFVISTFRLQAIQSVIHRLIPERFKESLTAYIGLNYNSYVLKRYLADIELIIKAPAENQVTVFKEMAAKHSNSSDFFLTFLRLTSYSDIWVRIKTEILKNAEAIVVDNTNVAKTPAAPASGAAAPSVITPAAVGVPVVTTTVLPPTTAPAATTSPLPPTTPVTGPEPAAKTSDVNRYRAQSVDAVEARLLQGMLQAEKELVNYSFLPQFHEPSLIEHYTRWIAPLAIASATAYLTIDFNAIGLWLQTLFP